MEQKEKELLRSNIKKNLCRTISRYEQIMKAALVNMPNGKFMNTEERRKIAFEWAKQLTIREKAEELIPIELVAKSIDDNTWDIPSYSERIKMAEKWLKYCIGKNYNKVSSFIRSEYDREYHKHYRLKHKTKKTQKGA